MNAFTKTVAGHAGVTALFTVVWEVAIAMPAGPADAALVVAGIVGPPAVAGVSLALIAAGQGSRRTEPAPAPPVQRRAVSRPQRKELAR